MKASRLGILSVGLIFGLSACDILGGGGPAITSFTATPSSITAGQPSVLAWAVDSTATTISINNGVGTVTSDTDDRVTVTPTANTTYTLTATNTEGRSTTRTATVTIVGGGTGSGGPPVTPPVEPDPSGLPTGTFGVSTSATGTFTNDADAPINTDTDERIISVADGGIFYAEVEYTDPDGITDISVLLVNSEPAGLAGELPTGPFTIGEPTGNCTLGTSATSVTCVYPITVAAGTPDIASLPDAGDEFAYVFRVAVTDGAGTPAGQSDRGYVNIQ